MVFEKSIPQTTISLYFIIKWICTSDFTWLAEMIKLKSRWFIMMTIVKSNRKKSELGGRKSLFSHKAAVVLCKEEE